MAKIIEILGNSGSGKTTLVAELLKTGLFSTGIEEHEIRPFHQASVETNSAVALANQVDFLLYRAEQEKKLREGSKTGLLDGGLEQDFYLFTRLFREKGYLDEPSYQVCQRLYRFFRESLGAPNLILWIDLPVSEVVARFNKRGRGYEITQTADLSRLEQLLHETIRQLDVTTKVIRLDGQLPLPELTQQALQIIKD